DDVLVGRAGVADQAEADASGGIVIQGLPANAGLPAEVLADAAVQREAVSLRIFLHAPAVAAEAGIVATQAHAEQADEVGRKAIVGAQCRAPDVAVEGILEARLGALDLGAVGAGEQPPALRAPECVVAVAVQPQPVIGFTSLPGLAGGTAREAAAGDLDLRGEDAKVAADRRRRSPVTRTRAGVEDVLAAGVEIGPRRGLGADLKPGRVQRLCRRLRLRLNLGDNEKARNQRAHGKQESPRERAR